MKTVFLTLAAAGALMPATAYAQAPYGQDPYADGDVDYAAPSEGKAGFRVEARGFYENINDPEDDIVYEFGNGIGAGAEVGFDFAASDNIVVGPYGVYEFSSIESCEGDLCVSTPNYWAVGLHVGLTTGAQGMIYGKLGYGQQEARIEGTLVDEFGDPLIDPNGNPIFVDETETGGGYNFAIGYDHSFGETFYGRAEVGVSESYDIFTFDLQRGQIAIALGARF